MAQEKNTEVPPDPVPALKTRRGHRSRADLAVSWRALATNVRAKVPSMPHLAELHTAFDRLVTRIEDSIAEQDTLTAQVSRLVSARAEDVLQGNDLRSRLVAQLQGQYGHTSDELRGFGLKPRKRKLRRKPQEETPTPAPEEPEPEPSAEPPTVV